MDNLITTEINLLYEIINHSDDVQDWIDFMITCKDVYRGVYSKFIYREFKIMTFYQQILPQCVTNNRSVKLVISRRHDDNYYSSTDQRHIEEHCRFQHGYVIQKILGIFFHGLQMNTFCASFGIDYEKIFNKMYDIVESDRIDNRVYNIYHLHDQSPIPNIHYLDFWESLLLTKKFVKRMRNRDDPYYRENKLLIYKNFKKNVRHGIKGDMYSDMYGVDIKSDKCKFCNNIYGDGTSYHQEKLIRH